MDETDHGLDRWNLPKEVPFYRERAISVEVRKIAKTNADKQFIRAKIDRL